MLIIHTYIFGQNASPKLTELLYVVCGRLYAVYIGPGRRRVSFVGNIGPRATEVSAIDHVISYETVIGRRCTADSLHILLIAVLEMQVEIVDLSCYVGLLRPG